MADVNLQLLDAQAVLELRVNATSTSSHMPLTGFMAALETHEWVVSADTLDAFARALEDTQDIDAATPREIIEWARQRANEVRSLVEPPEGWS